MNISTTLRELRREFEQRQKEAAETAYALAEIMRRQDGDWKKYALQSCSLYRGLEIHSMEEAVPTRSSVQGVSLPVLMEQNVVMRRFGITREEVDAYEKNCV